MLVKNLLLLSFSQLFNALVRGTLVLGAEVLGSVIVFLERHVIEVFVKFVGELDRTGSASAYISHSYQI